MRGICALIASSTFLSACAVVDDGLPAHNIGIAHQTTPVGIPGFEHLRWGMTENEIKQLYPEFGNAYGGPVSSASMMGAVRYRKLRIDHYKIGGCDFEVTLDHFGTVGDTTFDGLRYFDMHFSGGDFDACREWARDELVRQNGPHPKRGTVTQLWWSGRLTTIWFSDNNLGQRPSFDIVYKDATDVIVEPIITRNRPNYRS